MKLYKYFTPERTDVLRDNIIRYTQPEALNDPFEAKPHITKVANDREIEQAMDEMLVGEVKKVYDNLSEEKKSLLTFEETLSIVKNNRELMLGELGQMLDMYTPTYREKLHSTINQLIGILSLTEKPDNLLMWSHYATNHEGFVVGFDSRHSYFDQKISPTDEFRHLRKVDYRSARPSAPMSELNAIEFLLVKSKEWEYEQEWRIMRPLSDAEHKKDKEPPVIYLFKFPPEVIVEVILGARMNSVNRSALLKILECNEHLSHVDVLQASPDMQEFKLNIQLTDVI